MTGVRATQAAGLWLTVAVVLIAVGWFKTISLMLLGGYLMTAMAVLNAVAARHAARRLAAAIDPVPVLWPGESAACRLTVVNRSRWPVTARVECGHAGTLSAWVFSPLAGRSTRSQSFRVSFTSRGVHPVGPPVAEVAFPAGLVAVRRPVGVRQLARVLPTTGRIDGAALARWLARAGTGDSTARRAGASPRPSGGDVRGLRPYRPGDNPRDIHWRSTARRGTLMLREYDPAEPLDLVLVVEPYLPATPTAEDRRRLEWALSLAATLARHWSAAMPTTTVTVAVMGVKSVTVSHGRPTPENVRRWLAPLADCPGSADLKSPAAGDLARRPGRAAHLLVTTRDTPTAHRALSGPERRFLVATPLVPLTWYS